LDVEPATCQQRIAERRRNGEEKIPLEYLNDLDAAYFSLFMKWLGNALEDDSLNLVSPAPPVVFMPWNTYGTTEDVLARLQSIRLRTYTTPSIRFVDQVPDAPDYASLTVVQKDYESPPTVLPTSVSFDWSLTSENSCRRLVFHFLARGVSIVFWGLKKK
jgi:hypothetical protein